MSQSDRPCWDIFCKIVDNYGDIGICWRLSQQLVNEHHVNVRLFIDHLNVASKIIPLLNANGPLQYIHGVAVCAWPTADTLPAKVVIETFSCQLPESYVARMTELQSVWINLEYLSAEIWVGDFHAKPSPQAKFNITRHFFFPGFTEKTGGLIREKNLMSKRDEFLNSASQQTKFWQELAVDQLIVKNSLKISLFCYPQANVLPLVSALISQQQNSTLFITFNDTITTLSDIFADFKQINANTLTKENITIFFLPFLSQAHYDRLLWACDLNFVRGEDSWIRAIWASKAFIWQPYLQTEATHIKKMQAFLDLYLSHATKEIQTLLTNAYLAWSTPQANAEVNLIDFIHALPKLNSYAAQQADRFAGQTDLASNLHSFSEKLAKNKV